MKLLLDILQIFSTLGVLITIFFVVWQTRGLRKVARQKTYLAMVHAHGLYELLVSQPDLLRAHLAARGLRASTPRANRRRLYALMKLDIHEGSYLSHQHKLLDGRLWPALQRAMINDFQSPEVRKVWPHVRRFYAADFGEFAEEHLTPAGGRRAATVRRRWRRAGGRRWPGRSPTR
jgi:hypothetical protein